MNRKERKMRQESDRDITVWDENGKLIIKHGKKVKPKK